MEDVSVLIELAERAKLLAAERWGVPVAHILIEFAHDLERQASDLVSAGHRFH